MFPGRIDAIALGSFTGMLGPEVALLLENNRLQVIGAERSRSGVLSDLGHWKLRTSLAPAASVRGDIQGPTSRSRLVAARISSKPDDELVVIDPTRPKLDIITNSIAPGGEPKLAESIDAPRTIASLEFERGDAVSLLPMRLNAGALSDLVILGQSNTNPVTVLSQSGTTFTVTNTNDTGPGSLRQAIFDANNNPGADTINFNIPGTGVPTITPVAALPDISDVVTIDGTTQSAGKVELKGETGVTLGAKGLNITAGNCVIRGMVIDRFNPEIYIVGNGGNVIEGSYLGTDSTGNLYVGSAWGVAIESSPNNLIGGTTPLARNVISGNFGAGVQTFRILSGILPTGNTVQGNYIGLNASGTAAVGNSAVGVRISFGMNSTIRDNVISGNTFTAPASGVSISSGSNGNLVQGNLIGTDASGQTSNNALSNDTGIAVDGAGNTIGGTTTGQRNVVSGNRTFGICIGCQTPSVATGNQVQGNSIGTGVSGVALGNGFDGVFVSGSSNRIGGVSSGTGNTIAFNARAGVFVLGFDATGNAILSNSIFSNGAFGIRLAPPTEPPGPNNLEKPPALDSASPTGLQGTLTSLPNAQFRIECFSNTACDPSGYGQGQTFLGSTNVTTDAAGAATINFSGSG
ncbi:MAG: hypothetical protein ACREAC_12390, partial [Blastocatellia bacterium]